MQQWKLPNQLNEISGLALSPDERLFAVADEMAIVYELDFAVGKLRKRFALGDPVQRGDFEGIAVARERFYLVTSDGDIFETSEGRDGEQMDYARYSTGLGKRCEIEGLATGADRLLIACKEARGDDGVLAIFSWSLDERRLVDGATIELPLGDILSRIRMRRFNPSGIEVAPEGGNILLIAARQRALAELSPDGRLVAALRLPLVQRHHQPEGIALTRDGRLLIADEGGGHRARLAVYPPRDPEGGSAD